MQSATRTVDDPAFRATIDDVVRSVQGDQTTKNFKSPLNPANGDQISKDRRTVLVTWDMKGKYEAATKKIDAIEARVAVSAARHPGFYVGEAGAISSGKALDKMFADQLALAGERSIPITIAVLLLVFGALVAVGVPLLLALSGVMATIGLVALPSHIVPMDQNVSAVILLIGLAVGVDYSLFYIKREREERAAGRSSRAAIEAAAATSGRSVLISGITVMIAMAGMLVSGDKTYLGFGIATMMVVGISMLGSLTVLPALLSRLGDKVEKGKIPFLHRLRRDSGDNRFWKAILTPTLRHPAIRRPGRRRGARRHGAAGASPPHRAERARRPAEQRTDRAHDQEVQAAFSNGTADRTEVAIKADLDAPATQQAVAALKSKVVAAGLNTGAIDTEVNASHTVARIDIPLVGKGTDSRSMKRSTRSATTSCPRRSGRSRTPTTRSPERRRSRRIRTRC